MRSGITRLKHRLGQAPFIGGAPRRGLPGRRGMAHGARGSDIYRDDSMLIRGASSVRGRRRELVRRSPPRGSRGRRDVGLAAEASFAVSPSPASPAGSSPLFQSRELVRRSLRRRRIRVHGRCRHTTPVYLAPAVRATVGARCHPLSVSSSCGRFGAPRVTTSRQNRLPSLTTISVPG